MRTPIRGILAALVAAVAVASLLSAASGGAQPGVEDARSASAPAGADVVPDRPDADPRVRAFVQAYRPLIDSVAYGDDDVVFSLGARSIHFRDGRMLSEERLDREDECDPIFYRYPLAPLTEPLPEPRRMPTYCTDLFETLWGSTEKEVRAHGRSVTFLDHRMFVNELLVDPLAAVEAELRRIGEHDRDVARWIDGLDVTYSFSFREIAGSGTRSQHAWGLAVDLVPRSYHGRAVYWRWSKVFDEKGWSRIPIEERWSPPQPVIETFERNGFIWGGKWAHFDVIHFEYRPEILLYSRLADD